MLTVQYAKVLQHIRINAVDPGFTKTDLNHNTGTQTVEQGAEVIVRLAQISPDGPTGGFFDASAAETAFWRINYTRPSVVQQTRCGVVDQIGD